MSYDSKTPGFYNSVKRILCCWVDQILVYIPIFFCFVLLLAKCIYSQKRWSPLINNIKENITVAKAMDLHKYFFKWDTCWFYFLLAGCKRPKQCEGVLSCLLLCVCPGFQSRLEPTFSHLQLNACQKLTIQWAHSRFNWPLASFFSENTRDQLHLHWAWWRFRKGIF